MRTIAVYSYKGGNGKSLIAANLAVCLSRMGKNCVLVDWDIDAPSAHLKLGASQAVGGGGLVGLIRDCLKDDLKQEDWIKTPKTLKDIQFLGDDMRISDVDRYIYELDDVRDRKAIQRDGSRYGHIHLLPAGDTKKDLYWDTTWSPIWREMFTIDYAAHRQQELAPLRAKVFKFLRQIKAKLSEIPSSPDGDPIDYLLLDCRSGSSVLTMTLTTAWLEDPSTDRLVYCITFNKESINYLDRFAREIRDPRMIEMIIPVLCRVPTSFEYHIGDETLREALSKLNKKPENLLFLHSDRQLEAHERLRLGLNAEPDETTLTSEYFRLFERIIDPSLPHGWLAKKLGLPDKGLVETERIFDWDPDTGALVNPNDQSRNVSFKVETFQMFLVGLESGLGNAPGVREQLPKLLSAAGEQCGARFGRVMLDRFATEDDSGGVLARIEKWCKFDSDVGFGSFMLMRKSVSMDGGTLVACDILLRQSFLTPASDTKPIFDENTKTYSSLQDHRFCAFVRGYVRGVLVQLLNDKYLDVGHDDRPRHPDEKYSDSCIFTMRQAANRQGLQKE